MNPESVLHFWFEEIKPAAWWKKGAAFDALIARRFGAVLDSTRACELSAWRESAEGALALALAQDAVRRGLDKRQKYSGQTLRLPRIFHET